MPAWFSNASAKYSEFNKPLQSEEGYTGNRSSILSLALLATVALNPDPVLALETGVTLFTEAVYNDNINKDAVNEQHDLTRSVGANIDVQHTDPKNLVDIDYNAEYNDYKNNRLEDDARYNSKITLARSIVDDTFNWYAIHSHVERVSNLRDADIADNRTSIEYYSTGPALSFDVTGIDTIHTSLFYQKSRFGRLNNRALNNDGIDADNEGYVGRIAWNHDLTSVSSLVVGYNFTETDYRYASKIDRHQYFVGYRADLRTINYSIYVGGNSAKPENGQSKSGVYLSGSATKQFDQGGTFNIDASQQIADSGAASNVNDPVLTGNSFTNTPNRSPELNQFNDFDFVDTVKITRANAEYVRPVCAVCSLRVAYNFNKSDYTEQNGRDQTGHSYELGFHYQHTSQLESALFARYRPIEFDEVDGSTREDEIFRAGLEIDWNISRRFNVESRFTWDERKSDSEQAEYEAPAAALRVNYILDAL